MGRDLGLDGVVDHFTLSGDEAGWLRNKTGATRLGFAVQLKFLMWRGRFPRMRLELPPDAVEHVAKQVGIAASELTFYDFTSRAAKRHRSELRDLTGWHECTKTDLVKLVSHLVDVIWHDEPREEQVRTELLRQMRAEMIEPPTAAQVGTVIRSALHQADERAVTEVAARLARADGCTRRLDALVFTGLTGDGPAQDDATAQDDEDDVESVLADIKAHPGNVSLNSLLDEISKLKQVRAVGIPEQVFAGIGVQVVGAWRARASASSPSHLRRFAPEMRHVLLAALLFQRQREITDTLVELLNSTVHRINARAEKKVTEAFVAEFTKVRGKAGLLGRIAAASLGAPEGSVRDVVYPAADGEKTLKDLVAEMKATNAAFARSKREVFKSSYSNHYRAGLMKLLEVLDFRSSALYAPAQATAEIDLAYQLLASLNLRATTINVRRAELIRDAGSDSVDDQIATLRTELDIAGPASLTPAIELAGAFHHAVLDDHIALNATLTRLREQTSDEDHAYFVDIAHFMAGLPLDDPSPAQWIDGEPATRSRWRALVTARREHLGSLR
ncbi:DUF4158 domain-containing protein [Streptomyces mirabilis]|uniref:DUF4158 domain-containing protein n=1 Tax=Streptomyces mirabilis TaxID=68239 RepID=UPI0037166CBC